MSSRIDKIIIAILICLAILYSAYQFIPNLKSRLPWLNRTEIYSRVPSAFGISLGQSVLQSNAPLASKVGEVIELEPVEEGVMIKVRLDPGVKIRQGSTLILTPGNTLEKVRIECAFSDSGEFLQGAAGIKGKIVFHAPEGMLEPAPQWPFENFSDTGNNQFSEEEKYLALGKRYFKESRNESAIFCFRKTVTLSPFALGNNMNLAKALWHAGNFGEAAAILKPFEKTAPQGKDRIQLMSAYGTALLSIGLYEEAAEVLRPVLEDEKNPLAKKEFDIVLFNLALAERRLGNPSKAIELIDSSKKSSIDLMLIKSAALADVGRFEEAKEILEIASGASPIAALNYSILLRNNGRIGESIKILEKIKDIWQSEALVEYHIAKSYSALGDKRTAKTHFRIAAELSKDTDLKEIFLKEAN